MIYFFIPGEPRGKGRPRFGNGVAYTDERTREYEERIRECFFSRTRQDEELPTDKVFEMQCRVEIAAFFPVPKSYSNKKREEIFKNGIRPQKKPDADNIIKVILDALNGEAYKDDKQVVSVECGKYYAPEYTGVSVRIYYGDEI